MAKPRSLEEFADLTHTPVEDIDRYLAAGLLDLDEDGLFDANDVMRLQLVQTYAASGKPLDEFRTAIAASDTDMGKMLFEEGFRLVTVDEIVQRTGIDAESFQMLQTALGYAGDDHIHEGAIEMVRLAQQMVDAGMPWEGLIEGARVYADALRRLAVANLQITHRLLCEPMQREGRSEYEITAVLAEATNVIAPSAEVLIQHLYGDFLRQAVMDHALSHLEPPDPGAPPGSTVSTIVFIDLALFSTFAELKGDEAAVAVVDRFDRCVRASAVRYEGRIVKQIGDEFMLAFGEATPAVRFAIEVQEAMREIERDVTPRTGIHRGTVLYRMGDFYGSAVNIAARIASMALPNSILVTEPVAKAAADEGIQVEELGVRSLRGMEDPVPLYRVVEREG